MDFVTGCSGVASNVFLLADLMNRTELLMWGYQAREGESTVEAFSCADLTGCLAEHADAGPQSPRRLHLAALVDGALHLACVKERVCAGGPLQPARADYPLLGAPLQLRAVASAEGLLVAVDALGRLLSWPAASLFNRRLARTAELGLVPLPFEPIFCAPLQALSIPAPPRCAAAADYGLGGGGRRRGVVLLARLANAPEVVAVVYGWRAAESAVWYLQQMEGVVRLQHAGPAAAACIPAGRKLWLAVAQVLPDGALEVTLQELLGGSGASCQRVCMHQHPCGRWRGSVALLPPPAACYFADSFRALIIGRVVAAAADGLALVSELALAELFVGKAEGEARLVPLQLQFVEAGGDGVAPCGRLLEPSDSSRQTNSSGILQAAWLHGANCAPCEGDSFAEAEAVIVAAARCTRLEEPEYIEPGLALFAGLLRLPPARQKQPLAAATATEAAEAASLQQHQQQHAARLSCWRLLSPTLIDSSLRPLIITDQASRTARVLYAMQGAVFCSVISS